MFRASSQARYEITLLNIVDVAQWLFEKLMYTTVPLFPSGIVGNFVRQRLMKPSLWLLFFGATRISSLSLLSCCRYHAAILASLAVYLCSGVCMCTVQFSILCAIDHFQTLQRHQWARKGLWEMRVRTGSRPFVATCQAEPCWAYARRRADNWLYSKDCLQDRFSARLHAQPVHTFPLCSGVRALISSVYFTFAPEKAERPYYQKHCLLYSGNEKACLRKCRASL